MSEDDPISNKSARELHTEGELIHSNAFLAAVIENIPHMIFVKEVGSLRFVKINQAGEQLLGFSRKELIGKNDYDFFTKDQADFFTTNDRNVIAKGKLLDIPEEPILTKDRGERWLHTKKIPIIGEDGKPTFLLGISEDITEKKMKEDHIHELNKELDAFTYSVSHDLRAPLRAINGYAQILEEDYSGSLDEEGRNVISVIKHNAIRMGKIIDELLAFSRLGRKEIEKTKLDMKELLEGVEREFSKDNPHHAEINIKELIPVKADYGLIHQVAFNLISNAVKYSSKKEKPVITVESRVEGPDIIYSVEDNGAGFNMKYKDKLYGVFQRLHHPDEFEGLGVGLAIVKRIISRHGGKVWAEGKVNQGATFYFSLPGS